MSQPTQGQRGRWRGYGFCDPAVNGAKLADRARTTRCGEVHLGPSSAKSWKPPRISIPLPSYEFCRGSSLVRPVHGLGQFLARGYSGGERGHSFPPVDWHGGCYLHQMWRIRSGLGNHAAS